MPKYILTIICMAVLFPASAHPGDREPILCRISVENVPEHFQTRIMKRFADLIAERSEGGLLVEFYDNARLFRDSAAIEALATGRVEVIAPGIWQLDRYVPDTAALMLPSVYGRSIPVLRGLADGPFGELLSRSVETALGSRVLGPWLDLGYGNIFSLSDDIRSSSDIAGKRIRVAGGRANEERIRALGGIAVTIAWTDLPSYLSRGLVDGVLSTYETVDSGRLDAYGIRSVLESREYYPFYIPLANAAFWNRLTPELRDVFVRAWAEISAMGRMESETFQNKARENLVSRGVAVFTPSPEEIRAVKGRLMNEEKNIAERLNVTDETVRLLNEEIAKLETR